MNGPKIGFLFSHFESKMQISGPAEKNRTSRLNGLYISLEKYFHIHMPYTVYSGLLEVSLVVYSRSEVALLKHHVIILQEAGHSRA